MGSRHTKEIHYIKDDPETLKKLEQLNQQTLDLQKKLQIAKEENERNHDPKQYARIKKEVFDEFIRRVKTELKLSEAIDRLREEEIHFGVLGPISAGKTSFLNTLLGTQGSIGLGRTTEKAQRVFPGESQPPQERNWWDCPGNEAGWNFLDSKVMNFFYSLDICFLLFSNDLDDPQVQEMARVVYAIHPTSLVLVRTKCDQIDAFSGQKPVSEVLKDDRSKVKELLGADVPVIAISSKNIFMKTSDRFDWDTIEKIKQSFSERNKPKGSGVFDVTQFS